MDAEIDYFQLLSTSTVNRRIRWFDRVPGENVPINLRLFFAFFVGLLVFLYEPVSCISQKLNEKSFEAAEQKNTCSSPAVVKSKSRLLLDGIYVHRFGALDYDILRFYPNGRLVAAGVKNTMKNPESEFLKGISDWLRIPLRQNLQMKQQLLGHYDLHQTRISLSKDGVNYVGETHPNYLILNIHNPTSGFRAAEIKYEFVPIDKRN